MAQSGYTFLDLFAGGGGLSEGFTRAGFFPVAHVEMDEAACYTLKTRQAYHWLSQNSQSDIYDSYILGDISRESLYSAIPAKVLKRVLNYEISSKTLDSIFREIDDLLEGRALDLIVGGPPCQAYSLVGRARDSKGMQSDGRNYLYRMYARFLERYRPKFFVFENVIGLLSAKNENGNCYLSVMKRLFRSKGYATAYRVLSADEFGVPQIRKRVILIGKRLAPGERDDADFYPSLAQSALSGCSINELFQDLPLLKAGEGQYLGTRVDESAHAFLYEAKIRKHNQDIVSFHIARPHRETDLKIYKLAVNLWNNQRKRLRYDELPTELIKHNNVTSFLDRFKVVDGEAPYSHTIVAHIHKDGHYYIHPDVRQNRSLTPREAARLQTFPDDYFFESVTGKPSIMCAFKQIGNAVPVLLAECIANSLKEQL